MINKIKERIFLKDPFSVPKRKKVRLIIFFVFNLILISLMPILAICISFPYVIFCWIFIVCVDLLFNIKAFHIHTERYPLNNYSDYKFDPFKDLLQESENDFIIEIEKENNFYKAKLKEKTLTFDMKGCLFSLTIIKAYFVRQYMMKYINRFKLVQDTMGKNINIYKVFKRCKNIILIYKDKNKIKNYYLVKNYKTKMNTLMKSINGYGNVTWYITYHKMEKYYTYMSEKQYVSIKREYEEK